MRNLFVALMVFTALARAEMPAGYTIPTIDLAAEKERQIVVDREPGQYLGHPTTVLLEDGKTIIAVYPKGHGKGAIVMKQSHDGGWTWSERLPVPESWSTSKETPTIHRVVDAAGVSRLILWSGLYPARLATCELTPDRERKWTELKPAGDWGGTVVMSCLEPLKTGPGNYLAMFHDDGRYFTAEPHPEKPPVFTLYKTFSHDGGLTWSKPEAVFARSDVHLCEPGAIRSPDGKQIAVLLRENSRRMNSHVIFSDDEGATWSEPRELPAALTGDRHVARYTPDGRLFISFRDTTRESPTKGDWVAWVGRYEDIKEGREGQYRVRLMDNKKDSDCAYPGVEVLPNGTVVATTYGHWDEGEQPYIVSVRLTMDELDARAAIAASETAESKAARERAEAVAGRIKFVPERNVLADRWVPDPERFADETGSLDEVHHYVLGELKTPASVMAPLLRHPSGTVRALALSALFHREDPSALPLIAACTGDTKMVALRNPPTQFNVAPLQIFVNSMLAAYVRESSRDKGAESFRRYWEDRHLRKHCASWFAMRLRRAVGHKPLEFNRLPGDRSNQINRVLRDVDALPPIERALTLWYLARMQRNELPVPDPDMVKAFKALERSQLIAIMRGEQLSTDPDIYPPLEWRYSRSVHDFAPSLLTGETLPGWLLASASEFLPKSSAPEMVEEYEKNLRAAETGTAEVYQPERWLVAAAKLDPDRYAERLKTMAFRDPAAMAALWRLRGRSEVRTILKWLFDPEQGNSIGSESQSVGAESSTWGAMFLKQISSDLGSDIEELVRGIVSYPTFHLLSRTALTELRAITIRLDRRDNASDEQLWEHREFDPELPLTMARWRNELRGRFDIAPESVPDLPRNWITIRGPAKRIPIPDAYSVTLVGSTDTFLCESRSADAAGTVLQVRSLATGEDKFSIRTSVVPDHGILRIQTALSGLLILGCTRDSGVAVADLSKRSVITAGPKVLPDFENIRACVLDQKGNYLMAQLGDYMALYRSTDGAELWKRNTSSEGELMQFLDQGSKVAVAPDRGTVFILDTFTGADLARLDAHSGALVSLLTSADGQRLVTFGCDGRINVWDARETKLVRTIFTFAPAELRVPVALSGDGSKLAVGWPRNDNSVLVYDLDAGTLLGEVRSDPLGYFREIAFSTNGEKLVGITTEEKWLNVWDLSPLTKR